VFWHITPRQQTTVYFGMQSFDTAIKHFRKSRDFGHFFDRQTLLGQELGRTSGGDQSNA
jgi:hypothetical protein